MGTFSYAKLPMVKDLEDSIDLLVDNEVIAAIAGDVEAGRQLLSRAIQVDETEPDRTPIQDEHLILDADSSQNWAINEVLAGNHLVVKGPPGTGKSQTIANLIATLSARGKSVLFVAEKRAAIDAVLRRLTDVGAADLVLDVHDGGRDKRAVAEALRVALSNASGAFGTASRSQRLDGARARLVEHERVMHTSLAPWNVTPFQAQSVVLGTPEGSRTDVRWTAELTRLDEQVHLRLGDELKEFAQLHGIVPPPVPGPWEGAAITSRDQAGRAWSALHRLRASTLPEARDALERVIIEARLAQPTTLQEYTTVVALLRGVEDTLANFSAEVFRADLIALCEATMGRHGRKEHGIRLPWRLRRRLVKQARKLVGAGGRRRLDELHAALVRAREQQEAWERHRTDEGSPRSLPSGETASIALAELYAEHGALSQVLRPELRDVASRTLPQLEELLDNLAADQHRLHQLPRLHELRTGFQKFGLGALLRECAKRRLDAEMVSTAFSHAWHASILEFASYQEPSYGAFAGNVHDGAVRDYREADQARLVENVTRIKGAVGARAQRVAHGTDVASKFVRKQASLQRPRKAIRELVLNASRQLLDLKPCWAMSPLVVSQVLPRQVLFDVVVFDEASQVPPADAIPSIMRGRQVVVAGDEHQLPPTTFFMGATDEDEDEDLYDENGELVVSSGVGEESILEAMRHVARARQLSWHYRSRDDRLIAFSNEHIYSRSLTTFPGPSHESPLRHVLVSQTGRFPGQETSVNAEVKKVVELILQHALNSPKRSLGVITMSIEHARRIEAALQAQVAQRPDLDSFFAEKRLEPFFIKNLERVQGDERDEIILSMGYGKAPNGTLAHRFGPLNNEGGERRLNVAVTRAKRSMTLVSSFSSVDLDPAKLRKRGAKLLRAYLEYTESSGGDLGTGLNPTQHSIPSRSMCEIG
ncbi:DEAD/DEAH box helicase [Sphaerisporangium viridialbum]|uniref:DEAD/DEAH box helicase n=1 Tax=Sphaerisporangium viridialbum TaxID=46189 RepID=UPI003C75B007